MASSNSGGAFLLICDTLVAGLNERSFAASDNRDDFFGDNGGFVCLETSGDADLMDLVCS